MRWILYAMSVLWIGFGSFAILHTTRTREKTVKLITEADAGILGALPIIGGILLIIKGTEK